MLQILCLTVLNLYIIGFQICIFLHIPSPKRPLTVPPFIMVNNHNILYSDNVKYIGVYFDSSLSFYRHISNLLRSINFNLQSFRLISNFSQIHISPYLKRLHLLPITFRIIYKVLLLTHKFLHHNRLEYLSSLISIPTHTISLRSITSYLLHLPSKCNLHTTNIRAWHISSPYL